MPSPQLQVLESTLPIISQSPGTHLRLRLQGLDGCKEGIFREQTPLGKASSSSVSLNLLLEEA